MLFRAAALAWCGVCLAACGGSATNASADSGANDVASRDAGSSADGACVAIDAPTEAGASIAVDGGVLFGTATNVDPCANQAEALIVAGSGPTDRNGNDPPSLDTNAYVELASHFAEKDVGILASESEAVDALVSLEGAGRPAGECSGASSRRSSRALI
jgi:hypothetical protein